MQSYNENIDLHFINNLTTFSNFNLLIKAYSEINAKISINLNINGLNQIFSLGSSYCKEKMQHYLYFFHIQSDSKCQSCLKINCTETKACFFFKNDNQGGCVDYIDNFIQVRLDDEICSFDKKVGKSKKSLTLKFLYNENHETQSFRKTTNQQSSLTIESKDESVQTSFSPIKTLFVTQQTKINIIATIETNTFTINSTTKRNVINNNSLFGKTSTIILSVCVPILVFLGLLPLIHYYLVTKPKIKASKDSTSSSGITTTTTNDSNNSSSDLSSSDAN